MEFYNGVIMKYDEIGVAIEDFVYGGDVKLNIPILLPLLANEDSPITSSYHISNKCIINKNKDNLKVDKVTTNNYIIMNISKDFCPCLGIDPTCEHKGLKGQKFLITFIGGNINKPMICRRYEE